jgi:putative transposase
MEVTPMPWKEQHVLDQRLQFIAEVQRGTLPVAALCRQYGISRETGYTYLRRYAAEGPAGLHDRPRTPKTHPQAMADARAAALLALRAQHPTWGPVKLRQYLARQQPDQTWPAPSSIGALLHREGLCHRRPRRARGPQGASSTTLTPPTAPNQVWCIDFKGWFRTTDQQICYPLTLTDAHSRFLLRCQALPSTEGRLVQPVLEAAFREYGLPTVIRSDNGTPFASSGLGGLSRLAVWWLKLGIRPERIQPGRPDQNGRHERFHRTLKEDLQLTTAAAATLRAQQRAFLQYREVYNTERPHAALAGQTPAALFTPAPRPYPPVVPTFTYPDADQVRLIHTNGCLKWRGDFLYISEALCGDTVGLRQLTERHWRLRVGPLSLAVRDDQEHRWLPRAEANRLLALCEEEALP